MGFFKSLKYNTIFQKMNEIDIGMQYEKIIYVY